jgi:hypothetical protein
VVAETGLKTQAVDGCLSVPARDVHTDRLHVLGAVRELVHVEDDVSSQENIHAADTVVGLM